MSANKIDRNHLVDTQAMARFQQSQRAEDTESEAASQDVRGAERRAAIPAGEKLEISSSARKLAEMRQLLDAGRARLDAEPDVRREKVEEATRRLQSGVYATTEVRDQVAGRLQELMTRLDTLHD